MMESEKPSTVVSTTNQAEKHSDNGSSYEKHNVAENGEVKGVNLQRKLKSRHLQMIAIGGTIGTGLFIGSGAALAISGPAGTLIAFIFIGTLVYSIMLGLGEMATWMPVSGAFSVFAARFADPSLGFAMGWIYWFSWAITYALELTASGLIIQYWAPNLNIGIFIGIFWAIITALNFLPVNFYGEVEFYFSMIKVITVFGFLIFAICINAGAGRHGYLGFTYWNNPGAFAPYLIKDNLPLAKFVGFWAVLIKAGFSYQGTELVGVAVGETDNPRKTVPAAIKKTFYRICFFFVFTIFFIGITVPYTNSHLLSNDTKASASPLVIAAKHAGVHVLPDIINAVLLCVVLSAANSNVYSGSRILVGLALDRSAPHIFTLTTASGVPYIAVSFTAAFGFLGFLNLSSSGGTVFNWFLNISAVAGFICWTTIGISHICFMRAMKAQNIPREALPYQSFGQPWLSWYGVCFNTLIIFTQGFTAFIPWNVTDFFVAYVSLILFVILYVGHKIVYRDPFVNPAEADLVSGRREVDALVFEEKVPTTLWGKFWAWLG